MAMVKSTEWNLLILKPCAMPMDLISMQHIADKLFLIRLAGRLIWPGGIRVLLPTKLPEFSTLFSLLWMEWVTKVLPEFSATVTISMQLAKNVMPPEFASVTTTTTVNSKNSKVRLFTITC